jgi:hypothetical protein
MAASLRKKAKLGRRAGLPNTTCLVEPGFTVVGHELYFYIAYLESEKGEAARILEFGNAATSSVSGVFKQLRMWRNVVEYGLDEGPDGFWGGFLKSVLERLAIGDDGDTAKKGGANGKGTDGGSANLDEGLWMGSGASHVPV